MSHASSTEPAPAPDDGDERGRSAERPSELPRPGWRDVAARVRQQTVDDNASLIAAGLALYAMLAAFPALAASISVYGLFASPAQIADQIQSMVGVLPQEAADVLTEGMQDVATERNKTLGIGAVIGFLVALWSARRGMAALMRAMNIAYGEIEGRGWLRQMLVSLLFTAAAIAGFVVVLLVAVAVPIVMDLLALPEWLEQSIRVLRWLFLWILVVLSLALIYRFVPNRKEAKWRWVTWGSAIAATLWIIGSVLFALYAGSFDTYGEMYGALGGVVILLLWFYLTGFTVMLGAEINSELERQTARDTTVGAPKPMGQRGAYVADTLGRRT
ncbi:MAG: YihY/virulence factor BrkB family protein [Gammaproteobacteria bacterium]